MTGGVNDVAAGGSGVIRSRLEKDLRELERLLKADQQSGSNDGGGGASTIKQQLRSVLRKLMEAYFNPLNGERRGALYTPFPPALSLSLSRTYTQHRAIVHARPRLSFCGAQTPAQERVK